MTDKLHIRIADEESSCSLEADEQGNFHIQTDGNQVRRRNGSPVLEKDGLVDGEKVVVISIFGASIATARKDANGDWYAEDDHNLFFFEYDELRGWISGAAANKKALLKVTLYP